MTVADVMDRVRQFDCKLVEVTGGEPLHQPEAFDLIEALCSKDYEVLVETSGAIDLSGVDKRARLIMDVKCPGSEMADRMHWDNLKQVRSIDELQFVIKDRADYDWAVSVVKQHDLPARCVVLFSPVFGTLDPRQLAEWILADRLPIRFQLQLHKYVWAPDMRGV